MELTCVTAQSIFDDNAADIKLSWVAGLEGADRAFDVEFAREATSAADLVGHLNLIHPNRIQVLGKPEILYYQRLDDEPRKRQMGELILLEPPFLVVADGMEPPPDLELRIAILRNRVQADGYQIRDPEVLSYIAARVSTNVRQLEGALIRVVAHSSISVGMVSK